MRFRIGNFSIRRSQSDLAFFALEDYQSKIDRYRNGKPILRLHGPIGKGTIPLDEINRDFIANPKQRKALTDRFNSSRGLTNIFYSGNSPPPIRRQTKAKPSRARNRKAVRVRMANGSTHVRIQNVVAETPTTISRVQSSAHGGRSKTALASLGLIAGVGGIAYLVNRNKNN